MGLFDFGNIKNNERTIRKTWDEFRDALAMENFSYNDIEKAKKYYRDLFGLHVISDNDGNVILSEGLVLQEESCWKTFLKREISGKNNASELYFEERNIEAFIEKLEQLYPETEYVNPLMTHSWGQKVVRFYDPDGNLIEVGTPV